jgi:Tol biopolymer transport system component/DNA-binding winged helix-turn-helix (wHTH) protein
MREVYESGDLRIDLGRMTATRAGAAIPLEPKAFDVLVYLVRHGDRVVTKDELLDAVWTGTFVTPNVLTRAVAQIRKALGDETEHARFIETVAKRGYRFAAPVTVAAPAVPAAPRSDVPLGPPSPAPVQEAAAPAVPRRRGLAVAALASAIVALTILAAVVLVRSPRTKPDSASADLQLKRLTNRRGYSGTPGLSPDGRAIVYASDASGSMELYIATMVQGGAEVPLTADGGHNIQPAWSPDGQWIAFHSRRRGGVWVMPATGGPAQQISDFGSDPAWSPQSDEVVFTSDAGGLAGQSSLWIARRDGSVRRPLTSIGTPPGGHRAPAWSHDGRHVALVVSRGGWRIEVRTVDVVTRAQQLIDIGNNAADPVFTPDDNALLWGGTTLTGNGRLFRHAIDADARPVGATQVVLPMDAGVIDGLTVAANGIIAFAAGTLDANLWRSDLDAAGRGGEPIRLTDDVSRDTHADFCGDGRVVYMQTAVGTLPSVWSMDADGRNRAPLLTGTTGGNPECDRQGKRVSLVVFRDEEKPNALAWVDLESRRLSPVALPLAGMASLRLSPDASRIAFHVIEKDGAISVWTSTFDGARKRVAIDPEAVSYPAWSPDGGTLAVEVKRGDSTQVGIVPAGGGPVELLTGERGQNWPHSWAPDNDRIAFAGERGGVWNIYTISRRTRAITQVTSFTSAAGYVRYPAWAPSGSHIVYERAIEHANVWTMTLPRP